MSKALFRPPPDRGPPGRSNAARPEEESTMNNDPRSIFPAIAVAVGAMFATCAQAQQAQPPLYERLGGLKGITVVVNDFIDRLVANKTLNKNPAIKAGRVSSYRRPCGAQIGRAHV